MWLPSFARAVIAVAAFGGTAGCATARNYDDPSGPVVVGQHAAAARSGPTVRLVTFNVQWGEHLDRTAELLSRPGPLRDADVVFLQELDGPGAEWLARSLGMNFVYVPSAIHPIPRRDFGVAILSPWPIDDPRKVPLPYQHRFRKMRRAAAGATVHLPTGPTRIYAVHFETTFGLWGDEHRRAQARTVLEAVADWTGPVVIGGDFNSRATGETIARGGFVWLTEGLDRRLSLRDSDYILVRGLCPSGDPPAGRPPDDTNASDHRPVWATVRACTVGQ